jgi:hypothetical protein
VHDHQDVGVLEREVTQSLQFVKRAYLIEETILIIETNRFAFGKL